MPIQISATLPAAKTLAREGIDVRAAGERTTGARPLQIGLLNLMPTKSATETQIARLLGATPYEASLRPLVPATYRSRNTPQSYLDAHYQRWPEVRDEWLDGLIVTGAPLAHLPFEQVSYWPELTRIMDWTQTNVGSTYYICWGAQAALYHAHRVARRRLEQKAFGVFVHDNLSPRSSLMRGFDCVFAVPVSRHTEVAPEDLPRGVGLDVLSDCPETGLCLVDDRPRRSVYAFNHFEYDAVTLRTEYLRDLEAGKPVPVPRHYFPDDDPAQTPVNTWRHHANLLFRNWLREVTYTAMARGDESRRTA